METPQVPDHLLPPAPPEVPKRDASYGALISIVLILAIIVVGAFYVWGQRIEQNSQPTVLPDITSTTTAE